MHNGEHVGIIEVVVLRCQPFDPAIHSNALATPLTNPSVPPPQEQTAAAPAVTAGSAPAPLTPDAPAINDASSQTAKAKSKVPSRTKYKFKPRTRGQYLGLDGAWDMPGLSEAKDKKDEPDPWDNFMPPLETTEAPEASGNSAWDSWGFPPAAEEQPKEGNVGENNTTNQHVYHPVSGSQKATSDAGSRKHGQQDVGQTRSQAGSAKNVQHDPSQATSSRENGQKDPTSVNLRGGGSETQSIKSYHSEGKRKSPMVVNNSIVYNGVGTPPPFSAGPPPPRDFWRNLEKVNMLGDNTAKPISKKAPANDAWGNVPPVSPTSGSKEKVDDWNAGGSNMPGSWGMFIET